MHVTHNGLVTSRETLLKGILYYGGDFHLEERVIVVCLFPELDAGLPYLSLTHCFWNQ